MGWYSVEVLRQDWCSSDAKNDMMMKIKMHERGKHTMTEMRLSSIIPFTFCMAQGTIVGAESGHP